MPTVKQRPEPQLLRRPAGADDIGALNTLFADAFTERYRRDGLIGVRVPKLSASVWGYALRAAGDGAMLWMDAHERMAAFNIVHCSGAEGWMGPLAVRTDLQERGIGRMVVAAALQWLKDGHARTIGLETMPRTVENIGFYSRLGFRPGFLTITMIGQARTISMPQQCVLLGAVSRSAQDDLIEACRSVVSRLAPGRDFTNEMNLTAELGMGDTLVCQDRAVRGFALWHTEALIDGRAGEELRVLKLCADTQDTFDALMDGVEVCARQAGMNGIGVRCQSEYAAAYGGLLRRGYRVRWTDLRMTLEGYESPVLPAGSVLFSNWEI